MGTLRECGSSLGAGAKDLGAAGLVVVGGGCFVASPTEWLLAMTLTLLAGRQLLLEKADGFRYPGT